MKPLDRLLYAQGGRCFFCEQVLPLAEASVEHLCAVANGGGNAEDNCVVCCKSLNTILGSKSVKEKFRVVLSQRGKFKCPNGIPSAQPKPPSTIIPAAAPDSTASPNGKLNLIVEHLKKLGNSKPKKLKTLTSTVASRLPKGTPEVEIPALLKELQAAGIVVVEGENVTYQL